MNLEDKKKAVVQMLISSKKHNHAAPGVSTIDPNPGAGEMAQDQAMGMPKVVDQAKDKKKAIAIAMIMKKMGKKS